MLMLMSDCVRPPPVVKCAQSPFKALHTILLHFTSTAAVWHCHQLPVDGLLFGVNVIHKYSSYVLTPSGGWRPTFTLFLLINHVPTGKNISPVDYCRIWLLGYLFSSIANSQTLYASPFNFGRVVYHFDKTQEGDNCWLLWKEIWEQKYSPSITIYW